MVDLWFIVDLVLKEVCLICIVWEVNDGKLGYVVNKVREVVYSLVVFVIVCLGFVFKVNIDDLCESLLVEIVCCFVVDGVGKIFVVEFYVEVLFFLLFGKVELIDVVIVFDCVDIVVLFVDYD